MLNVKEKRPLCTGHALLHKHASQLMKAWGLGGCGASFNPHSKELNTLLKRVCSKS